VELSDLSGHWGRPREREARRFVRDPRAYFLDFFPWGSFDGLIKSDKTFEERVTGNYPLNFLLTVETLVFPWRFFGASGFGPRKESEENAPP